MAKISNKLSTKSTKRYATKIVNGPLLSRAYMMRKGAHRKNIMVNGYRGNEIISIYWSATCVGHKVGEFISTKRIGPKIHDTKRNKKRLERIKQNRGGKKK